MKAIAYHQYGPADVLHLEELPNPAARHGQILVRVHAASVNPVDFKIRRGDLKLITGRRFPRVPGIDFAGVVTHASAPVDRFKPGDEVFGVLNAVTARHGTSAEFVIAKEKQMAHKPPGISFQEAAAIPCAGLTSWHALRDLARLRSGQHVLINGAAGGVGSFAVQIARYMGAAVTGTSSAENLDFVRSLGAEKALDYRLTDVRKLPDRFHAILDAAATLEYSKIKHLLKPRGVYVRTLPAPETVFYAMATAVLPGRKARIVVLNGRESVPKALTDLAALTAAGRIRVHFAATFPLDDLAQAHRNSETGHSRGKIGIQVV